jgi:hypothetical protein
MRSVNSVLVLASLACALGADTTEYCCPDAKKCLTPSLSQCNPSTESAVDDIHLESFDKPLHKWSTENDPVMGGKSSSTVKVSQGYADYNGVCRIVPQLKAPGFTIALTGSPLLAKFPDTSSMDGLTISLRQLGSNYSGFKIAFCDSRVSFKCQFQSYKADLPVPASADFQDVFVPWSKFSDKWDSATGKHTAEDPPKAESLKSITQLQIWTEGVEGDFHLQVQNIRASKAKACPADYPVCCPVTKLCVKPGADCVAPPVCKSSEYCCPDAKHCLEASTTSCAADAKACDGNKDFPVCCPLTKLCVKVGAECDSPCGTSNSTNFVV